MASIKFLLQGKTDPANVVVLLSLGRGKQYKRVTGFVISPKSWKVENPAGSKKILGKAGMPKQTNDKLKNLHVDLQSFKVNLQELLNIAIKSGDRIDGLWLESMIDRINNKTPIVDLDELTNVLQVRIDKSKAGIEPLSANRIKGYITFQNTISKYEKAVFKGRKILVREVNKVFGDDFITWLFAQKYSVGYTAKNIDNLKAICNYAESIGIETSSMFRHIKAPQQKAFERKRERPIVFLSESELEDIKNVNLDNEALINARKWLLFGCDVGQRGSDLLDITKEDITESDGILFLEITQKKTDKKVSVPLLPNAVEVYQSGMPYKIALQNFNDYIKILCEKADIDVLMPGLKRPSAPKRKNKDTERQVLPSVKGIYPKHELVSSHVCRRSFATNYYRKVPTPFLIDVTGHGTERMFLEYIGEKPRDNAKMMMEHFMKLKDEHKKPKLSVLKNVSNE